MVKQYLVENRKLLVVANPRIPKVDVGAFTLWEVAEAAREFCTIELSALDLLEERGFYYGPVLGAGLVAVLVS